MLESNRYSKELVMMEVSRSTVKIRVKMIIYIEN